MMVVRVATHAHFSIQAMAKALESVDDDAELRDEGGQLCADSSVGSAAGGAACEPHADRVLASVRQALVASWRELNFQGPESAVDEVLRVLVGEGEQPADGKSSGSAAPSPVRLAVRHIRKIQHINELVASRPALSAGWVTRIVAGKLEVEPLPAVAGKPRAGATLLRDRKASEPGAADLRADKRTARALEPSGRAPDWKDRLAPLPMAQPLGEQALAPGPSEDDGEGPLGGARPKLGLDLDAEPRRVTVAVLTPAHAHCEPTLSVEALEELITALAAGKPPGELPGLLETSLAARCEVTEFSGEQLLAWPLYEACGAAERDRWSTLARWFTQACPNASSSRPCLFDRASLAKLPMAVRTSLLMAIRDALPTTDAAGPVDASARERLRAAYGPYLHLAGAYLPGELLPASEMETAHRLLRAVDMEPLFLSQNKQPDGTARLEAFVAAFNTALAGGKVIAGATSLVVDRDEPSREWARDRKGYVSTGPLAGAHSVVESLTHALEGVACIRQEYLVRMARLGSSSEALSQRMSDRYELGRLLVALQDRPIDRRFLVKTLGMTVLQAKEAERVAARQQQLTAFVDYAINRILGFPTPETGETLPKVQLREAPRPGDVTR